MLSIARRLFGSWNCGLLLMFVLVWAACGDSHASVPTLISSIRFESSAIAVAGARGCAFVVVDTKAGEDELTLEIVSLSDPHSPSRVASLRIQGSFACDRVRIQAIGRWVIVVEWSMATTGPKIFAIDTENILVPNQVAPRDCPVVSTYAADNVQFFSDGIGFGGIKFLPDDRGRLVGQSLGFGLGSAILIPTAGEVRDVFTLGDLVFVAEGAGVGLTVLRMGPAPAFTSIVGKTTILTPGSAQAVAVAGGHILVADGSAGLTIIEGSIPPGSLLATVDTPGSAVDVAAAGDLALVADAAEGLQVIELPETSMAVVSLNEFPEAVRDLRVMDISSYLELASANYTVTFVLPAWGGLSGAAGDTITMEFPFGTGWFSDPPAYVRVPAVGGVTATVDPSLATLTLSLLPDTTIPGGTRVVIDILNAINPLHGTEYALFVSTSRSPALAVSNTYTIGQDALGWFRANVIPLLAAVQADTRTIQTSLADVAKDITRIGDTLDSISDTLTDLADTISLIADDTADLKRLVERKVELEEEITARLESLDATASQLASYLYEKLQLERGLAAALEELLGTANEIRSGVETKIELEEEMSNILQDLADCLATLELTGELLPPFEARSPLDLVLALDSSGSMEDNDPNRLAAGGASTLLDKLDWKTDQVGLVSWDDDIDFQTALGGNAQALKNQLGQVDQDGGTSFDVGLTAALDALSNARPGVRKVIIFLTDGEGDYTLPGNAGSQVDRAKNAGVQIYAIGLGNAPDMAKLKAMAEATGGRALHAKQAADLTQIYRTLAQELMNPWFVRLQAQCGG